MYRVSNRKVPKLGDKSHEMVEDFIPDDLNHLERLNRGDGVDQHIAMDADEMLGIQNAVLVLFR